MFYGGLKELGKVEIVDVSIEAFLCLQKYGARYLCSRNLVLNIDVAVFFRYIYTDSFDGVTVANMIDVLAASKKYLMAKLARYCYQFIQSHITTENAVSLWCQVQL